MLAFALPVVELDRKSDGEGVGLTIEDHESEGVDLLPTAVLGIGVIAHKQFHNLGFKLVLKEVNFP